MTPVELAKEVMEDLDITPVIEPIRGGTDGSKNFIHGHSNSKLICWWRKYARSI